MNWEELQINGVYQNKKNKQLYRIVNFATHSETQEWMVVYMALYPNYKIWVRPFNLFLDKFQWHSLLPDE